MFRNSFFHKRSTWLAALIVLLVACNRGNPAPPTSPIPATLAGSGTSSPVPSATPFQPSPTPLPLAARVNGVEIGLAEYQAELARYQAALGKDLAPEDQKRVLDDLIDLVLLAEAAVEEGFAVDDAMLEDRIERLQAQLGGAQALGEWMAAHGYVEESFRRDLARSIAAAWKRDQLIADVPQVAEQVHASQILVNTAQQANEIFVQLEAGQDFAGLAEEVDPVTQGDLGWFPRGYLADPKLEEAAFSLEAGKYSQVIETRIGFHLLQVIERDPQRPLEPDALVMLQEQGLLNWLQLRRSQSQIQVLLP